MRLAQHGEFVLPGVRPVTLLIASGILLVAAILLVTGLVAGHLREEALASTQIELARINLVLAESNNDSVAMLDGLLKKLGEALRARARPSKPGDASWMAAKDVHELLVDRAAGISHVAAIELADVEGRVASSSRSWPVAAADISGRDYFNASKAGPGTALFIGTAVSSAEGGPRVIPMARRVEGDGGQLLGVVYLETPVADFEKFYATVPISDDASITLLRNDGTILARNGSAPPAIPATLARHIPVGGRGEMIPDDGQAGENWKIQSIRALQNYPLAILVTRGGAKALAVWLHQAWLFGAFAVAGALVVAAVVAMIARQFRTYADLASVRAEKIEMERAKFAAEAELLKKERLSVLGQLTATVAHELRNPLSAIRNTLFSIKEIADAKDVNLSRPAARMERSIDRCDRIIGDLLEYTKQRELRRTPVRFDHWLEEVVGEQTIAAGVTLTTELRAPQAVVPMDADRIRRVVINLVDNAVQAMLDQQANCPEKRITVRTEEGAGMLALTVEDTGPGISPENLGRIFEPLFSTKSFGTGLGLATVKQIVTQHEGDIRIDSEVGRGTRVIVELPLRVEEKVAA
ncbi:MAG TPA: ATP-binding protein [Stellaceae bacterium]|nr:ATP-binding protein [Stellaceae bacterium]